MTQKHPVLNMHNGKTMERRTCTRTNK